MHGRRYGYARKTLPVEAVNYRVQMTQRIDNRLLPPAPVDGAEPALSRGDIILGGGTESAVFADRASLPPGFAIDGPAVIEEPTATTLAPAGWRARVLDSGDLMVEKADP